MYKDKCDLPVSKLILEANPHCLSKGGGGGNQTFHSESWHLLEEY